MPYFVILARDVLEEIANKHQQDSKQAYSNAQHHDSYNICVTLSHIPYHCFSHVSSPIHPTLYVIETCVPNAADHVPYPKLAYELLVTVRVAGSIRRSHWSSKRERGGGRGHCI